MAEISLPIDGLPTLLDNTYFYHFRYWLVDKFKAVMGLQALEMATLSIQAISPKIITTDQDDSASP